jgi:hypothetical protein
MTHADLLTERLASLAPSDDDVDVMWNAAARQATLEGVLTQAHRRSAHVVKVRSTRRRRLVLMGASVAAAAVALAVAIPALTPPGLGPVSASPAAAAELDRLSNVAQNMPSLDITEGQYIHQLLHLRQVEADGSSEVRTQQWWVSGASDGFTWRKNDYVALDSAGHETTRDTNYIDFSPIKEPFSPANIATIPTSPQRLEKYLRDYIDWHGDEGNSQEHRAVFDAIGHMLGGGLAPPDLRVAALEVLKHLPYVDLGPTTSDELGRPVIEFIFKDPNNMNWVSSLRFDPDTAELLEQVLWMTEVGSAGDERQHSYSLITTELTEVVNAVPTEVLNRSVHVDS